MIRLLMALRDLWLGSMSTRSCPLRGVLPRAFADVVNAQSLQSSSIGTLAAVSSK